MFTGGEAGTGGAAGAAGAGAPLGAGGGPSMAWSSCDTIGSSVTSGVGAGETVGEAVGVFGRCVARTARGVGVPVASSPDSPPPNPPIAAVVSSAATPANEVTTAQARLDASQDFQGFVKSESETHPAAAG